MDIEKIWKSVKSFFELFKIGPEVFVTGLIIGFLVAVLIYKVFVIPNLRPKSPELDEKYKELSDKIRNLEEEKKSLSIELKKYKLYMPTKDSDDDFVEKSLGTFTNNNDNTNKNKRFNIFKFIKRGE